MKELIFNDNAKLELTDNSSITDCITVVKSFSEVDDIKSNFTEDNLNGGTFDGETIEHIVPVEVRAVAKLDGNVEVHFINRAKSHDEIVDEQLEELQSAILG